jgi:hypothetical protein
MTASSRAPRTIKAAETQTVRALLSTEGQKHPISDQNVESTMLGSPLLDVERLAGDSSLLRLKLRSLGVGKHWAYSCTCASLFG